MVEGHFRPFRCIGLGIGKSLIFIQYVAQYPGTSVEHCNNFPLLVARALKLGPEKICLVLNMTKDSFCLCFQREINIFALLLCCPVSGQLVQYPETTITTQLYIHFDRQATYKLLLHLQSILAIDSKNIT